jgi:hypothetical protein
LDFRAASSELEESLSRAEANVTNALPATAAVAPATAARLKNDRLDTLDEL